LSAVLIVEFQSASSPGVAMGGACCLLVLLSCPDRQLFGAALAVLAVLAVLAAIAALYGSSCGTVSDAVPLGASRRASSCCSAALLACCFANLS
jgi:hypothetical protein